MARGLVDIGPVYFLLPTVSSFPAMAGSAGAQAPGTTEHRAQGFRSKVSGHPMSSLRRRRRSFRTRTHRLQNEFQVERYAAFLRLASSRESTSATIPSITG